MKINFWQKLKKTKKPILALAPMAGITDSAFRQVCKKYGADVVYTEMVSADGLFYDSKKTLDFLRFAKAERPVVIQLFGKNPERFTKATQLAEQAGFDGIDINFGCPAKKVAGHGGGVTLMRDLNKCRQIIEATLAGTKLPVSVKLRTSINKNIDPSQAQDDVRASAQDNITAQAQDDVRVPAQDDSQRTLPPPYERRGQEGFEVVTSLDFLKAMQGLPISAVMIHGRPYENPFQAEIDYEMIKKCVQYLKETAPEIVVLGNGGINIPEDARKMLELTGVAGLGLARGLYGRPWLFKQVKEYLLKGSFREFATKDIIRVAKLHAKIVQQAKSDYGIIELRKHLLWYVKGRPNASELRANLVKVENIKDIKLALKDLK